MVRVLWSSTSDVASEAKTVSMKPFRADQILVSETKITWKSAYPLWFCQECRADKWDWGAGAVCRDTSISLKHQLCFPLSPMGRLQISGGLGGYQEEGIPGSGRLNACSSKPLVSAQSCLIWWLQPHEQQQLFHAGGAKAATQLKKRKCPSSQGLRVSWSPGQLLKKWA